jgi:hypothetical protein
VSATSTYRSRARQPRLSWLRALPFLVRPITQTMPWITLIAGCLTGTIVLALIARVAHTARWQLGQGDVRLAFLTVVAALAFVLRTPFRPLTQALPVPAWLAPVGHILLAAPVVAVTCWVQLRIMADSLPSHTLTHAPAVYPLVAQLTGWSAVAVMAAAWVDRSRYADLGGAIAAPVTFGIMALAWHAPGIARFLAEPSATAHGVTFAWYAIASVALILACAAMRDHWHRYSRVVAAVPAWRAVGIRR